MPLAEVVKLLRPVADLPEAAATTPTARSGEPTRAAVRICADLVARVDVLLDLGPDHLGSDDARRPCRRVRPSACGSPPAARAGLFGMVHALDEPSAGPHPADTGPLPDVLDQLRASDNSLFAVEHALDGVRRADGAVDIGPGSRRAGCA
ncbi:UvrABC system protein A [Streptomyces sp. enrichment culture]